MRVHSVILAAGRGTRMYSQKPKVLHKLAGKPLLHHVVQTAQCIGVFQTSVVVGFGAEQVRRSLLETYTDKKFNFPLQLEQLGTGHAVMQALPFMDDSEQVLILYGDVPLISEKSLAAFIEKASGSSVGILTVNLNNPTGYGRIIRDSGRIVAIIEQKDASEEQKNISEVNTGIMLIPAKFLRDILPRLSNDNAQKEYYLTDVVKHAVQASVDIFSYTVSDDHEVSGVNDRVQLSELELFYQRRIRHDMLVRGVTFANVDTFILRGELLELGTDIEIDQNVIFEGSIRIGSGVTIGANCVLRNVEIKDDVCIRENSVIDGAKIGQSSVVGPFARLRPGTVLASSTHVGNFVELKNTVVGDFSKVNHLSYVGDAEIGVRVNVGAGTITCNYDGVNKHKTVIKDDAFIGSNSSLVAPVVIHEGATVGAGSVICREAQASTLTVARARQVTIEKWKRPEKISKP